jgi:pathogenesis-related protein 1
MQARNLLPILLLSYASPVLAQTVAQLNQGVILSGHNTERQSLGLSPLQWSSDLQSLAQNWANNAAQRDPYPPYLPGHRQNRNNVVSNLPGYIGESIYVSDCTPKPCNAADDGASAVSYWVDEKTWYNPNLDTGYSFDTPPGAGCSAPQPGNSCGHYTQVVWRATQRVGCGAATSVDGSFYLVCDYWPGGNLLGTKPY